MFLNIIVGFLVAVLMGMGVGGGGLFVIFLTLCLNFGQINAQGTNLVFFILAIIASIFVHVKKRKIYFKQVLVMTLFGAVGSVIFSSLANHINPEIPRKMLGGLLVLGGAYSIYNTFKKEKQK